MSESFYKKPLAGLLLLAGAAGGPYMFFESGAGTQTGQSGLQWPGSARTPTAGIATSADGLAFADNPLNPAEHSMEQVAIHSLQEVLRFDISPGWVLQRFPRVTTVLAETQLDGLRVPLITGTTPSDIAGTLTYSFDRYQRLQRLTVHGATGDPVRFVSELQQQYQMQQVPALGGVLYILKWNGQATSLVHIEPAPVIYADAPFSRFNIMIELNQAGLEYGLSREASQLIEAGKSVQRW